MKKMKICGVVLVLMCFTFGGCASRANSSINWWERVQDEGTDGMMHFVGAFRGPNTHRSRERAEDNARGSIASYIYSAVIRNAEDIACGGSTEKEKNNSVKATSEDVSKNLRILINQARGAVLHAKAEKYHYDEKAGVYYVQFSVPKEDTAIDAQREFQAAIDGLAEKFAYDQQKLHEAILEINGTIGNSLEIAGFEVQKSNV